MDGRRIGALFLIFLAATAHAKDKVFLVTNSDSPLGQLLVFKLKEALRSSPLLFDYSETDGTDTVMTIRFGTVTAVAESLESYAIVWTIDNQLINFTHGTCGRNRLVDCAQQLVATTDQTLSSYRKSLAAKQP